MDGIKNYLTSKIKESLSKIVEGVTLEGLGIGGDVVLENLTLQKDVLQHALKLPVDYDIARGTVRELRLSIPWTRIISQSQPVLQVSLRTVEILVRKASKQRPRRRDGGGSDGLDEFSSASGGTIRPESDLGEGEEALEDDDDNEEIHDKRSVEAETPPKGSQPKPAGWLAALSRKLLMNLSIKIDNLTIQYEEKGIVASAHLCEVLIHSADPNAGWAAAYNDLNHPSNPWLFKAVTLQNVTLCLDERSAPSVLDSVGAGGALGGPAKLRRRHEAPFLDRASVLLRLALDMRDVFPSGDKRGGNAGGGRTNSSNNNNNGGGGYDGANFPPLGMDGIFLDSPYAISAYCDPPEDSHQRAISQGRLPRAFETACPILQHGVQRRWRVPTKQVGPWEDPKASWRPFAGKSMKEEGSGGDADPPHAVMILAIECARLRFSLSDRQASLLRKVMKSISTGRSNKLPPRASPASLSGQGDEPAASIFTYHRLRITSFHLQALSINLVNQQSLLMEGDEAGPSWVFMRLQARDLTFDSQELSCRDNLLLSDVRIALGSLEIVHTPDHPSQAAASASHHSQQQILVQWGVDAVEEGDLYLYLSAPQLLKALSRRVLIATGLLNDRGKTIKDAEGGEAIGEALRPGDATALVLRRMQARHGTNGEQRQEATDCLVAKEVKVCLAPEAILALISFVSNEASASGPHTPQSLKEIDVSSPSPPAPPSSTRSCQQQFQLKAGPIDVRIKSGGSKDGRQVCVVRLAALILQQGVQLDGTRLKSVELSKLWVGVAEAETVDGSNKSRIWPIVELDRMTHYVERLSPTTAAATNQSNLLQERMVFPQGGCVSVLPEHVKMLTAMYDFVMKDLLSLSKTFSLPQIMLACNTLEAKIRGLAIKKPPPTFVQISCGSGRLEIRRNVVNDEAIYLLIDGFCVREKSLGLSHGAQSPGVDTILRSPQLTFQMSISNQAKEIKIRSPGQLRLFATPLKFHAFRRAVLTLAAAFSAILKANGSAASTPRGGGVKKEIIQVEVEEFVAELELPWLVQEFPQAIVTCQKGVWMSSSEGGKAQRSVSIRKMSAEGNVASTKNEPPRLLQLQAIQGYVEPFLGERDAQAFAAALQDENGSPIAPPDYPPEFISVPVLIPASSGKKDDPPIMHIQWEAESDTAKFISFQAAFGSFDLLCYFPVLYAVHRLVDIATGSSGGKGGVSSSSKACRSSSSSLSGGSETALAIGAEGGYCQPWTFSIDISSMPCRFLMLGGPIQEACFGLLFSIDELSIGRLGGRGEQCMEMRKISLQPEVGQWSVGSNQDLSLIKPWAIANKVVMQCEEFSQEGAGGLKVLRISPVELSVGRVELAILWKALNIFGRSTIRAPKIDGGGGKKSASSSGGKESPAADDDDVMNGSKVDLTTVERQRLARAGETPNLKMACSLLHVSFRMPTADLPLPSLSAEVSDDFFSLTFKDCQMAIAALGGSLDAQGLVLTDLRNGAMPESLVLFPREASTSLRPSSARGSSSAIPPAMLLMWRKALGGGTSDMTIQLQPSLLSIDPTAILLLIKLAGFVNLQLDTVADGMLTPRNPKTRAPRPIPRRTETVKFLTDHLRFKLLSGLPVGDGDDEAQQSGLDVDMEQLVMSYRTSVAGAELYFNLVQAKARIMNGQNGEGCGAAPALPVSWPFLDRTNAFLSLEEPRVRSIASRTTRGPIVGSKDTALPPPVASINIEPLGLHLHPHGLLALNHLMSTVGKVLDKPGSSPPAAASSSLSPPAAYISKCLTELNPLANLEMLILDDPPPEPEPGLLVARSTPLLRPSRVGVLSPRDYAFVHVQEDEGGDNQDDELNNGPPPVPFSVPILTWAFPHALHIASVRLPEPLVLHFPSSSEGEAVEALQVIFEVATKVEGPDEGSSRSAITRFSSEVKRLTSYGDDQGGGKVGKQDGCNVNHRSLECDHGLSGRVWQISMSWDTIKIDHFPLEKLWRPLVLALADNLMLETFSPQEDRLQAVLQVSIPHTLLRLYPLTNTTNNGDAAATAASAAGNVAEELAVVLIKDLQALGRSKRGQGRMEGLLQCLSVELDILDLAGWALLPALRIEGLRARGDAGKINYTLQSAKKLHDCRKVQMGRISPPSCAFGLGEVRLNVSKRIVDSVDVLRRDFKRLEASPPSHHQEASRCFRYRIINRTRHVLWFGQHLTNETVRAEPLSSQGYSWRAFSDADGDLLLLRFSLGLRSDLASSSSQQQYSAASPVRGVRDGPSVWSLPVGVDKEGVRCVPLRTSNQGLAFDVALPGKVDGQVLLWITVERRGLETRVILQGGCQIRNMLPLGLDLRFSATSQKSNTSKTKGLKESFASVSLDPAAAGLTVDGSGQESSEGFWASLLLAESLMDLSQASAPPTLVIKARVASKEKGAQDDAGFGDAMHLELPTGLIPGLHCLQEPPVGEATTLTKPSPATDPIATSCTVLGQAPAGRGGVQPIWFLCHLRRVAVQAHGDDIKVSETSFSSLSAAPSSTSFSSVSRENSGKLVWGWLSLEMWPVAYLMTSSVPAHFRVLPLDGGSLTPGQTSAVSAAAPLSSPFLNDKTSAYDNNKGSSSRKEVDLAKRAIREKLQRLSWKSRRDELNDSSNSSAPPTTPVEPIEEESVDVVGGTPHTKTIPPASTAIGSTVGWTPFATGPSGATSLVTVDPRKGLALSLMAPTEHVVGSTSSTGFLVPRHCLLAWVQRGQNSGSKDELRGAAGEKAIVPLADPATCSGINVLNKGVVPYAVRRPSYLGPSLLINVAPAMTLVNHCPFAISLAALMPREGLDQHDFTASLSSSWRGSQDLPDAEEQKIEDACRGLYEVGLQILNPGLEAAAEAWAWPMSSPPPVLALGVTVDHDSTTGQIDLREAKRDEPWAVQSWSRPLLLSLLASLLQEEADGEGCGEMVITLPVRDLWLPLCVRLVPRDLSHDQHTSSSPTSSAEYRSNPLLLASCLEIRPRLVLHNSIKTSKDATVAMDYGGNSGFSTLVEAPGGLKEGLSSQVVFLRRGDEGPDQASEVWIPLEAQLSSSSSTTSPRTRKNSFAGSSAGQQGKDDKSSVSSALKRMWHRVTGSSTKGNDAALHHYISLGLQLVKPGSAPRPREDYVAAGEEADHPCQPLEIDSATEDLREVTLECGQPGPGLWGVNGQDVMALRIALAFQDGTHHLVVSVEPSIPLIVVNHSMYDVCLGLLGNKLKPITHSSTAATAIENDNSNVEKPIRVIRIASGAKVEWDPARPAIHLRSIAPPAGSWDPLAYTETLGGSLGPDLDGSSTGVYIGRKASLSISGPSTTPAAHKGSPSKTSAVPPSGPASTSSSYRRSTFPTKALPTFRFRARCCLSQQASNWSDILSTSEKYGRFHALDIFFSSAREGRAEGEEEEAQQDEQAMVQGQSFKTVLAVKSALAAGVWCMQIEDGHLGATNSRILDCSSESRSLLQQLRQQPESRPSEEIALVNTKQPRPIDLSLEAAVVEIQMLEDDIFATGLSKEAHSQEGLSLAALLFIRCVGIRFRYSYLSLSGEVLRGYRTVEVGLLDMQADHLVEEAEYPVVFCFLKPQHALSRRALDFRFTEASLDPAIFSESRPASFVETLFVSSYRIRASVDGPFLHTLTTLYSTYGRQLNNTDNKKALQQQQLLVSSSSRPQPARLPPGESLPGAPSAQAVSAWNTIPLDAASAPRLFFRSVRLGAVSLILDARLFIPGSGVFLGLEGSPLSFEEVVLESIFSTPQVFVRGLLANYLADAILRSPVVLGSLEILGSPAVLLSRVLSGLKDLVIFSAAGTLGGPFAALAGAGRGLWSLTRHVVGGTLSSLSGISRSVRRNLDGQPVLLAKRVSRKDQIKRRQQQQHKQPIVQPGYGTAARSTEERGKDDGMIEVRRQNSDGVAVGGGGSKRRGLISGVGRGLVKAVTTPISGAMGVVWWTSERLISTTGVNRGMADGRDPLKYGDEGTGVFCQINMEAFYRLSCRLTFPKGSYVGNAKAWLETSPPSSSSSSLIEEQSSSSSGPWAGGFLSKIRSSTPSSTLASASSSSASPPSNIIASTLVLAGEQLFCLSGGHGAEVLHRRVALSAVARWRHLRAEPGSTPRGLPTATAGAKGEGGGGNKDIRNLLEVYEAGGEGEREGPLRLWMADEQARLFKGFLGRWINEAEI